MLRIFIAAGSSPSIEIMARNDDSRSKSYRSNETPKRNAPKGHSKNRSSQNGNRSRAKKSASMKEHGHRRTSRQPKSLPAEDTDPQDTRPSKDITVPYASAVSYTASTEDTNNNNGQTRHRKLKRSQSMKKPPGCRFGLGYMSNSFFAKRLALVSLLILAIDSLGLVLFYR